MKRLPKILQGVFPVLPTPLMASGQVDEQSLRHIVRYLLACGVDGMTFPGVASEFGQLSLQERTQLTELVMQEAASQVPVIVGASAASLEQGCEIAGQAHAMGAAAVMVAAPPGLDLKAQISYFGAIAEAAKDVPIMLQNVPPPVGAGLDPRDVLAVAKAVSQVQYVKEEALPSGQRLSVILAQAPASLQGVFGGAGGRYITDELRRGACGTMPAIELAEVHVALFKTHRQGDSAALRQLFTRMLPILNIQAVFRWSLTKYVLHKRGLIASMGQRAQGPLLDAQDQQDVDAFLADIADLLLPQSALDEAMRTQARTPSALMTGIAT